MTTRRNKEDRTLAPTASSRRPTPSPTSFGPPVRTPSVTFTAHLPTGPVSSKRLARVPSRTRIPQLSGTASCSASTSRLAASMAHDPATGTFSFTSDRPFETGSGIDIEIKNDGYSRAFKLAIRTYTDSVLTLYPRILSYGSWLDGGLEPVTCSFPFRVSLSGVVFLVDLAVTLAGGSAIFSGSISPE